MKFWGFKYLYWCKNYFGKFIWIYGSYVYVFDMECMWFKCVYKWCFIKMVERRNCNEWLLWVNLEKLIGIKWIYLSLYNIYYK